MLTFDRRGMHLASGGQTDTPYRAMVQPATDVDVEDPAQSLRPIDQHADGNPGHAPTAD